MSWDMELVSERTDDTIELQNDSKQISAPRERIDPTVYLIPRTKVCKSFHLKNARKHFLAKAEIYKRSVAPGYSSTVTK